MPGEKEEGAEWFILLEQSVWLDSDSKLRMQKLM
jgi:hypothetical protein